MKRNHEGDYLDEVDPKRDQTRTRTVITMNLPPSMGINNVPHIMTISKNGNDMDDVPNLLGTNFSIPPRSMEEALMALIVKTEETCRHELLTDRRPVPTNGVLYDRCNNLHLLVYKGNTNFLLQSDALYIRHNHPEHLRFKTLLSRSRTGDSCWQEYLHMYNVNQLRAPCIYELVDDSEFAIEFYLRRKLDSCTPFTELDAYVVANAYHAELEVYDGPKIGHTNYRFRSSCRYSYKTINKPRPKWILFKDHRNCWQAIVDEITNKMYFNYRTDHHSTILIEGERVPDAPGVGKPSSDDSD